MEKKKNPGSLVRIKYFLKIKTPLEQNQMQNIVMYSKTHKVQQVSNQLYIPWRNKTFLVERCVLSQGAEQPPLNWSPKNSLPFTHAQVT